MRSGEIEFAKHGSSTFTRFEMGILSRLATSPPKKRWDGAIGNFGGCAHTFASF